MMRNTTARTWLDKSRSPRTWIYAVPLGLAISTAAYAQLYRYIGIDNATITSCGTSCKRLNEGGTSYIISQEGVGYFPARSTATAYAGSTYSLRAQIPSSTKLKDRSELEYQAGIPFGQQRATGFAMKLSTDFPKPNLNWVILAQWWQSAPESPPLRVQLKVLNENKLQFYVLAKNSSNKNGTDYILSTTDIVPGQWYRMQFEYKFGPNGFVRVWSNGTQIVNWTGELGYSDETQSVEGRVGIYRQGVAKEHNAYFDQIKYGTTRASVDPAT